MKIQENPQGVVVLLKNGTIFTISTETVADAKALAVVIGTLGVNQATPVYGPRCDQSRLIMSITDDLGYQGPTLA